MGDPKAFLNIPRQEAGYRPVNERIADYSQVEQTLNTNSRKLQASRCMDCGVPFCHWACPIGNKQPEWQDALYRGKWKEAYEVLSSTCDFPEFTGRICPALCEKSCVLKLSCDQPVTIRENEAAIVEAAFREGYIQVKTPESILLLPLLHLSLFHSFRGTDWKPGTSGVYNLLHGWKSF
jgi:glutamate synthase (NADPH) small chain